MAAPTAAELYAALHTGTPGDTAFYVGVCDGASSVLELGCGYGRMLAALHGPGRRLVGIDHDPGLLALARGTLDPAIRGGRIRLHAADMRTFSLGERFERVILPHTGLYCLMNEGDLDACLSGVREHLADGGRFVLDAWAADDFHASSDPADLNEDEATPLPDIVLGGVAHRVHERSCWQKDASTIVVRYEVRPGTGGPALHHEVVHRYWTLRALEPRLQAAGLELSSVHGGFHGEPYDEDAEGMIVVARRR